MPTNNLPAPLTRFIGREKEITAVMRLSKQTRLLTLTGAGGCGKTRLALQVANELCDDFPDGVWFVDLTPLTDAALVPSALASLFALRQTGDVALIALLRNFLREKNLLIVLDNCEHLILACAQLSEALLTHCPAVKILATSREALNIPGETAYRVPSLALPDLQALPPLETFAQTEAIRLFVARAQAVQSDFQLTEANKAAVAQICARLDGMPLAIELAAARIKTLTVAEIDARLDDRFRLLNQGNRTAPTRQQTLRAAIDWSYALLSAQERTTLNRLSVFAGGWTLEATEAVNSNQFSVISERNSTTENWILNTDILDLLSRLVDKSLVIAESRGGTTRYRILETIRKYAREKLEETAEVDSIRRRHLDFFLHLASVAEPHLVGSEPSPWLKQLDDEYDNLRVALQTAIDLHAINHGLQLVAALRHYWQARGYFTEGRTFAGQLLAASDVTGADIRLLRAQVLEQTAWFAILQNDFQTGDSLIQQSIVLYQELQDQPGIAHGLSMQSFVALNRGDTHLARSLIDQALALVTPHGEPATLAAVLNMRGLVLREQGDYAAARTSLEEALAMRRALANKHAIANSLNDIGATAYAQGDPTAEAYLAESLKLRQELADRFGIPRCLHDLGTIALSGNNLARAHECFTQGLAMFRDQSDHRNAVKCLEGLAGVAAANHQTAQAARLLGAAEAAREAMSVPLPRTWRVNYDRTIAMVRQQLGAAQLAAMWAQGRTMSLAQAIAYALTEIKMPDAPASTLTQRQSAKEKFGGLTAREREVAALIAQGKSNREIADALVLSERTIEGHVGNILNKLGFNARTQIATWATQKGL